MSKSRPDYSEGLSKDAPGYVKRAKKQEANKAAANMVPIKFAGGKGGLVKAGANLLVEARRHGMKVPSDCKRGECNTCRRRARPPRHASPHGMLFPMLALLSPREQDQARRTDRELVHHDDREAAVHEGAQRWVEVTR